MSPLRRRRFRPRRTTVAIAGAGAMGVTHALAARSAGMVVTAVASAGRSSARHLAGQIDARPCRAEDLPAGADLLVVATPPESHVDLAIAGLAGGAVVLVEKPIAHTLADGDRLASAVAERPGRPVSVAENLLHAPPVRLALQRRSAIGRLDHLSLRTVQAPPTWGHFTRPLLSGGVLFDLGPHALAVALALADDAPVAVSASLGSSRPDGVDDEAQVTVEFAGGLTATLEVSWTADQPQWGAQAASASGVVRIELIPEVLVEHDGDAVEVVDRWTTVDPRLERLGYVDQLIDTMRAAGAGGDKPHDIGSEASPTPGQTVADAIEVLELITAAYASAGDGGRSISIPFTGDRTLTPLAHWRGTNATPA